MQSQQVQRYICVDFEPVYMVLLANPGTTLHDSNHRAFLVWPASHSTSSFSLGIALCTFVANHAARTGTVGKISSSVESEHPLIKVPPASQPQQWQASSEGTPVSLLQCPALTTA